jgi:Tol biopolymer transport system component
MTSTVNQARSGLVIAIVAIVAAACALVPTPAPPTATPTMSQTPGPATPASTPSISARQELNGILPVVVGTPIELSSLRGRIVFDNFEDVYTMNADGTDFRVVAGEPGPEFDGAWSPDGASIVYRDSRRGINEDDEVYIVAEDGTGARNLTQNPANDWGPDWSPDGNWIAFNSDRDGTPLRGYLVAPDGTNLHPIDTDVWFEYPSFSPDGRHIVFEGHADSDYDVYTVELETGHMTQLTDAPGHDGWAAWSPDGTTIAFTTQRDDCARTPPGQDCWYGDGEPGEHHTIWLMNADGSNQRRVTPEAGQFVAWSPDGEYLLISGRTLFAIRPDGTGRVEIRPPELRHAPGGIPDWTE